MRVRGGDPGVILELSDSPIPSATSIQRSSRSDDEREREFGSVPECDGPRRMRRGLSVRIGGLEDGRDESVNQQKYHVCFCKPHSTRAGFLLDVYG